MDDSCQVVICQKDGVMGELRHYIESHGGNVVSAISLSVQHDSNRAIALSDRTKLDLRETFGVKLQNREHDMTPLNNFLKERGLYGGNHEALTESEVRALVHMQRLDEARNRRASARQEGNAGVRNEAIQRDGNQKTGIEDNSKAAPGEGGGF